MKPTLLCHPLPLHGRAIRLCGMPALLLLVAAVYALVHATGGVKYAYTHSMYVPVLVAGLIYGLRGGVVFAIVGGLVLGPMMPLDVATNEWQSTANWAYRTGFFVLAGSLVGTVSDAMRLHAGRLRRLAWHDFLTGMPNRTALLSALKRLARRKDQGGGHVLAIISVENSDELGSAFGFEAIDGNVRDLAERAAQHLPAGTRFFRVATEQIGFLANCSAARTPDVLSNITVAFQKPFDYHGIPIHADTHIGYVTLAAMNGEPESYLRKAQAASLFALQSGHDVAAYHDGIRREARENLAVLGELMGGLERNELSLHYQPKVSLRTGSVCGVEALMRWQHRERGRISPAAFIPRAEQSTLIHSLTEFALEQALRQAVAWHGAGMRVPIAVNVSARNLVRSGFATAVTDVLERCGASADMLELEVTESALISDVDKVVDELRQLADAGIRLAIDDFGAGYSSLTYAHRLPVSVLKIDQSFIRGIADDANSLDIVEAVVSVAHKKGLETVAEGVEDQAALGLLRNLGCDTVQGFAIAKPMPAPDFEAWYKVAQGAGPF